ncbi:MAG TPA: hypothetical protein PK668_26975 [Myxococcota bacterium]|nr:hypothetical protein [Myxococcota bacterium]HRY97172.1 hypothetical protein [Myxococcota bacterium]HSA21138.1 hypothetical protein [Myxococcota bacterium]
MSRTTAVVAVVAAGSILAVVAILAAGRYWARDTWNAEAVYLNETMKLVLFHLNKMEKVPPSGKTLLKSLCAGSGEVSSELRCRSGKDGEFFLVGARDQRIDMSIIIRLRNVGIDGVAGTKDDVIVEDAFW